jgi:hypothetical protein
MLVSLPETAQESMSALCPAVLCQAALALSNSEQEAVGYVSSDETLPGFQHSSRGRLDLALTTNTVNHIRVASPKHAENGKWEGHLWEPGKSQT